MTNKFTRSLTTTKITFAIVTVEDGKVVTSNPETQTFTGEISRTSAMNKLQNEFGFSQSYAIIDVVTTDDKYEMDLETFLEYATKVEPKAEPIINA